MTTEQIQELACRGHEIGSHSVTHSMLTTLSDESLRVEMERSRTRLQSWTRRNVDGFCYPEGDYDERVMKAARAAGYSYGCTVNRGIVASASDRMALPRRAILPSSRPIR